MQGLHPRDGLRLRQRPSSPPRCGTTTRPWAGSGGSWRAALAACLVAAVLYLACTRPALRGDGPAPGAPAGRAAADRDPGRRGEEPGAVRGLPADPDGRPPEPAGRRPGDPGGRAGPAPDAPGRGPGRVARGDGPAGREGLPEGVAGPTAPPRSSWSATGPGPGTRRSGSWTPCWRATRDFIKEHYQDSNSKVDLADRPGPRRPGPRARRRSSGSTWRSSGRTPCCSRTSRAGRWPPAGWPSWTAPPTRPWSGP